MSPKIIPIAAIVKTAKLGLLTAVLSSLVSIDFFIEIFEMKDRNKDILKKIRAFIHQFYDYQLLSSPDYQRELKHFAPDALLFKNMQ